ncbi:hypothetical protein C8J56DRAFT_1046301 [Mycena floridula]|nr:hypothetical protein C8J56DRAFT_1046301 [Mycena floridula]
MGKDGNSWSTSHCIHGPLRFVRELEFWQCRCHLDYLGTIHLIPSHLHSLTLQGYHLDTPYDILTRFQNLQMSELGHWVDFLEEADNNEEPHQADNLTGYLSQSLVDLHLVCLRPGAVRHFALWLASHQATAGKMPPVNKLQVRNSADAQALFYLSPLLAATASTLTELHLASAASRVVAVETRDIIVLPHLQVFNLECWDSMLEPVFFLIRWEGTLQSLRIKPTVSYIIWDSLPKQYRESVARMHSMSIKRTFILRYAPCAVQVTFAEEDDPAYNYNSDSDIDLPKKVTGSTDNEVALDKSNDLSDSHSSYHGSDSGNATGSSDNSDDNSDAATDSGNVNDSGLDEYKGANVSWTWLPCWDEKPNWHKARAEQALWTGQLQEARWNVHVWDTQAAEDEEPRMDPHRCRLAF